MKATDEQPTVVWQRQMVSYIGEVKAWITHFAEKHLYFLYFESSCSNPSIGTSFTSEEEAIRYANAILGKGREPTRIRITKEGKAYAEWWNLEAKEALCHLCGKEGESCRGCTMMNPYCG